MESHLSVWLSWSLKSSVSNYLAGLKQGETCTAEQALAAVMASNREAKVKSVSYFTRTSIVLSYALCTVDWRRVEDISRLLRKSPKEVAVEKKGKGNPTIWKKL
jgi:hypothetical protein